MNSGHRPRPLVQYAAAGFAGDANYARSAALTIGGVGGINFEVQALVYIVGAYTSNDRVFMVQFPASRQAGLFSSNTWPTNGLQVGDSQAGSVGGNINTSGDINGHWCLLTFSADGTLTPTGKFRGTVESLDGTISFQFGEHVKGVESSLQGERVDLNGGGVDFGWLNGIRYAEVRAYNAQRSDAQRQADLRRSVPEGGEIFWWRFSDDGIGGVQATDITGNGILPTMVGATLEIGPLF